MAFKQRKKVTILGASIGGLVSAAEMGGHCRAEPDPVYAHLPEGADQRQTWPATWIWRSLRQHHIGSIDASSSGPGLAAGATGTAGTSEGDS